MTTTTLPPLDQLPARLEIIRTLLAEKSLYEFLKQAWPHFDPSKFMGNWHIGAIAEHLQAVNNGQIKRLLINIPPRHCKTAMVSVAWPLWTWIQKQDPAMPLRGPGVRFLCAAYGAGKAQQDGVTSRRLIDSVWFQQRWGRMWQIEKTRDNMEQFDNTAGGYRISTGIPESLGKGGAIRICFPYDQTILTERGLMEIGEIVDRRLNVRVQSLNEKTKEIELRAVSGWHRNPGSEIIRLRFNNGVSVRCTPDHRFLVASGEWKTAGEMPVGTIFAPIWRHQIKGLVDPITPLPDCPNDAFGNSIPSGKRDRGLRRDENGPSVICGDLGAAVPLAFSELCDGGEGSVASGVIDVIGTRAITEIHEAAIASIAVGVSHFLTIWNRPEEGEHDDNMHPEVMSAPLSTQGNTGITIPIWSSLEGFADLPVLPIADPLDVTIQRLDPSQVRNFVAREINDGQPPLLVGIDHIGWASSTYCVTVEATHTMLCGGPQAFICAANCDDIHKVDEVESKLVIASQIRAYNEIWRTRSNDPKYGAEVIIGQRLGEDDIFGYLLSKEEDFVHLCLPARYESARHCETEIGFSDPRTEEGELLWPERFGEQWAREQEASIGAYAWSGQFLQRPEPRGGGIIKRAWWKLYGPDDPVASGVRFPPFSFVLASLDTAYTAKEANDPSALVIMGVWTNVDTGYQNVMLVYAWEAHLELPDLVRRVKYTCDKYRIDRLLIENKAAGHPVEQELSNMFARENWGITFTNPGRSSSGGRQDKEARLHSISHLFEEGMVHRPNTQWAVAVEDQVSIFPRAQRDDYVDCLSAGLRWLRDNGLLHRKVEQRAIETELEQYRGGRATSRPLYAA